MKNRASRSLARRRRADPAITRAFTPAPSAAPVQGQGAGDQAEARVTATGRATVARLPPSATRSTKPRRAQPLGVSRETRCSASGSWAR